MHRALLLATLLAGATLSGCLGAEELGTAATAETPSLILACAKTGNASDCGIDLDGPGVNEFSVAANPLDPNNAIITANDYGAPSENNLATAPAYRLWGSWWVTKDGGATWTKHIMPGMLPDATSTLSGYTYSGDLVVTFGPDGTAYIAGMAYTAVGPISRNAVFFTHSTDGGDTFAEPQLVDSAPTELIFHDKPAIAVDADNRIYLAWNFGSGTSMRTESTGLRFARSMDGGATWSFQMLSAGDSAISGSIAIDPEGGVNVAWRSYRPYAIRFARSVDHGESFSEASQLRELEAMDLTLPNTSYRAFALPTLVTLPDGTLLCTVPDEGPGGDSDIYLMRSTDAGASWTEQRLNTDNTTAAQFLPTLAASPDGTVVAVWLDRSDDPDDATYVPYVATSRDGVNFTAAPLTIQRSEDPRAGTTGSTFIGDYIGAAIIGNRVYVAWPDLRDGDGSHLYGAALTVS